MADDDSRATLEIQASGVDFLKCQDTNGLHSPKASKHPKQRLTTPVQQRLHLEPRLVA